MLYTAAGISCQKLVAFSSKRHQVENQTSQIVLRLSSNFVDASFFDAVDAVVASEAADISDAVVVDFVVVVGAVVVVTVVADISGAVVDIFFVVGGVVVVVTVVVDVFAVVVDIFVVVVDIIVVMVDIFVVGGDSVVVVGVVVTVVVDIFAVDGFKDAEVFSLAANNVVIFKRIGCFASKFVNKNAILVDWRVDKLKQPKHGWGISGPLKCLA